MKNKYFWFLTMPVIMASNFWNFYALATDFYADDPSSEDMTLLALLVGLFIMGTGVFVIVVQLIEWFTWWAGDIAWKKKYGTKPERFKKYL